MKILRPDRGGEHLTHELYDRPLNCGIFSQLAPSGTLQHNVVTKGRNKTLLDMV